MKKRSQRIGPRAHKTATDPHLIPLAPPVTRDSTSIASVSAGMPIPAITRVKTFSEDEWEDFIAEWATCLTSIYHKVFRCGGAGDMGRDVVAHTAEPAEGKAWDNYQCKHYDHPLMPSDIWTELGKLAYYTHIGVFSIPRMYYFVAPQDVGTTLARLIERPEELRNGLIQNWPRYCLSKIRNSTTELTAALKSHISSFPFDRVTFIPTLKVIEQHQQTRWHVQRFGGGLPDRPRPPKVAPAGIGHNELKYVSQLLAAYSESQGVTITESDVPDHPTLHRHFLLSRASFYSAEALSSFSRAWLPPGEFQRLQEEIENGVQETYMDQYVDGFEKVKAVTKAAVNLPLTDHALLPVMEPPDKRGICHQLVEADRMKWVEHG